MRSKLRVVVFLCGFLSSAWLVAAERIPKPGPIAAVPPAEWVAKVRALAPGKPTAPTKTTRQVLVFDLFTGYHHTVIPHVNEVLKVLAERAGRVQLTFSGDIEQFVPEKLKTYDAVILNNCCSVGTTRNIFLDVMNGTVADARYKSLSDAYKGLSADERKAKASMLEASLIAFVASGKGLVAMHGGIVMQNNSPGFGEMMGGSFDYHPPAQELTLYPADNEHPMLMVFRGESFTHTDEPYLFKGAYAAKNFRPLLKFQSAAVQGKRANQPVEEEGCVAWIKRHGRGRVFYVSPSHFPDSYLSAAMLRFQLDGIQYALGDLEVDDAPKGR